MFFLFSYRTSVYNIFIRAVGNVVVQYAKKVLGVSRVVGIAGSQDKCEWLLEIGADAALNYKSKTFAQDLENVVPNGVDKWVVTFSILLWDSWICSGSSTTWGDPSSTKSLCI